MFEEMVDELERNGFDDYDYDDYNDDSDNYDDLD